LGRSQVAHRLDVMLSSCIAPSLWLLASLAAAPFANVPHPATARVRPLHISICEALDAAYAASPTVRHLVDELEGSDLIIHLLGQLSDGDSPGMLRFVGSSGGARFVRITLDTTLPVTMRAALLGHELQHALEVARASWVHDQDSFAALYRSIGHAVGARGMHYDTLEARRVGRRVMREMAAERPGPAQRATGERR
jgi:hypothetical protein